MRMIATMAMMTSTTSNSIRVKACVPPARSEVDPDNKALIFSSHSRCFFGSSEYPISLDFSAMTCFGGSLTMVLKLERQSCGHSVQETVKHLFEANARARISAVCLSKQTLYSLPDNMWRNKLSPISKVTSPRAIIPGLGVDVPELQRARALWMANRFDESIQTF